MPPHHKIPGIVRIPDERFPLLSLPDLLLPFFSLPLGSLLHTQVPVLVPAAVVEVDPFLAHPHSFLVLSIKYLLLTACLIIPLLLRQEELQSGRPEHRPLAGHGCRYECGLQLLT